MSNVFEPQRFSFSQTLEDPTLQSYNYKPEAKTETQTVIKCASCGAMLTAEDRFCTSCGARRVESATPQQFAPVQEPVAAQEPTPIYAQAPVDTPNVSRDRVVEYTACPKCGMTIMEGQLICSNCGERVDKKPDDKQASVSYEESKETARRTDTQADPEAVAKRKKKKKKIILLSTIIPGSVLAIAAAVIVSLLVISNNAKDTKLYKAYDKYCSSSYAEISFNGKELTIDTDPSDSGRDQTKAINAIVEVNDALKLPDDLIEKMAETKGSDGKQSASYKDIDVTWSYSSKTGLVVTYSID